MIAHLKGREKALGSFGWTGRRAEWIALASHHSGAFTRAQATWFLDMHHERARRLVHALIAQGLAAEETVPGIRGIGRVCRIFSRRIYRALGAEHIRHRRNASPAVLLRRLLSLDHVIEHTDLPWLPTAAEKVGAFEALGLERSLLPVRVYRGAAAATRHYFPVKLPVALDSGRAVFVYAEPGHDTSTALRYWGKAHSGLWRALERRGRPVEVFAVARTSRETERARRVMRGWAEPSGPGEPDAGIREELARIEVAILQGAVQVLDASGRDETRRRAGEAGTPASRRPGGDPPRHRLADWASGGRALPMTGVRFMAAPACEIDSGGDSQFGPPAIHTERTLYPPRPHRLAPPRPGHAWRDGALGRCWERPTSPRASYGFGRSSLLPTFSANRRVGLSLTLGAVRRLAILMPDQDDDRNRSVREPDACGLGRNRLLAIFTLEPEA